MIADRPNPSEPARRKMGSHSNRPVAGRVQGGTVEQTKNSRDWGWFEQLFAQIQGNVERVIQGKPQEVRLTLVTLIAEGHLLIEDVPGVGKTMLAKAMARSIDCSFRRIQFTPDL